MKKGLRSFLIMAMGGTAVILYGSIVRAGVSSDTIGIKFGVNFPKGGSVMDPSEVAGVPGVETANWNNAFPTAFTTGGNNQNQYANLGTLNNLVRDTKGVATVTNASVSWSAEATWSSSGRGEENNQFGTDLPGDNQDPNRKLMLGYLDHNSGMSPTGGAQHTNRVDITGLPDDMARGFDVIIYELGGQGNGRGGTYTVNGVVQIGTSGDAASGTNGPTFVQDPGDGTGQGNYLRFTGLSGTKVTIRARNDNFRAVINAVEIVATGQ